jgi:pyruvate dehydrogenase E1 component beta subunit
VRLPVVIRVPFGGGIGAVEHHSESPEAYFAHTAGLRVVTCSDPADGYWMIQQAAQGQDPVIFFEAKRRYWEEGPVDLAAPDLELHRARVIRSGEHLTLASYGAPVRTCLRAAEAAAEAGWELEVIDLRSLSPLDVDTVVASVGRTGRLVVVHEASTFVGVSAELAAAVTERCFYQLEAPVLRVGGYHTPYPASRVEQSYLPDVDRILAAVERSLSQ